MVPFEFADAKNDFVAASQDVDESAPQANSDHPTQDEVTCSICQSDFEVKFCSIPKSDQDF
jgi:hypothetical protein